MARPAPTVALSTRQRTILNRMASSRTLAQRLVERAQIVLAAADGMTGFAIAKQMNMNQQRPQRWRRRWAKASPAIDSAEAAGASDGDLSSQIAAALSDAPRAGTRRKFSPETVAKLVSLACEPPEDSGVPFTHWTPDALAKEAIARGITEDISPRHLDRLLKRSGSKTA